MFEAYTVGVILKLKDLVTPEVIKLFREFEKLDLLINRIQGNLREMGLEAAGLRAVADASDSTARALERANVAGLSLERRLAKIRELGATPLPGTVVAPSRGGHSGLHGGRIHAGSEGVGVGAFGYGLPVDAMAPAAGLAVGGYAGLKGYEAAKDFQMEVARFKALGLPEQMNREAVRYAESLHAFGTSQAEALSLFRDAQTIFRDTGSLHHAEVVTPILAKMRFANRALYGAESAAQSEGMLMDMLKVIELRKGLTSEAEFARQADMIQKVQTTSGGRVSGSDYLAFLKTGGTSTYGLTNEAMYYSMEPLIQEMGGNRVGTSMQTAYNRLTGITQNKVLANEALRLGIWNRSAVHFNPTTGEVQKFNRGDTPLKDRELFFANPFEYFDKYLLPAYKARGISKDEDIFRENALLFGRTGGALFSSYYRQRPVIQKSVEASKKALSIDQLSNLAQQTPEGKEQDFLAAWTDFKKEFGAIVLPEATKILYGGAQFFHQAADFIKENRELVKEVASLPGELMSFGLHGGVGGWLARKLLGGNDQGGSAAPTKGNEHPSPYLSGMSNPGPPLVLKASVNLDGRVLGQFFGEYLGNELLKPSGTTGFDPILNPTPQGLNYSK